MNQETMQALLTPPDLFRCRKVLVIQPHPDDAEVGAGGIIARLTDAGISVAYLTVTTGGLGSRTLSPEETAAVRAKETEAAGRALGVKEFYSAGLPDRMELTEQTLARELLPYIRAARPDGILAPDPWLKYEGHSDHRLTGLAATTAFLAAGSPNYPREGAVSPWEVAMMGYYFTAAPNTVVDVTDTFDRKFEAMALHASQMDPATLDMYRAYFSMKGRQLAQGKGFALGEGLKLFLPLHLHCFVDADSL